MKRFQPGVALLLSLLWELQKCWMEESSVAETQLKDVEAEQSCFNPTADPVCAAVCTEAKKHCWYFEGLYPTYYICRSYEDCCGSRCCVRALSIQRLWYFWFLLMMGVLFCCGAGFFIRRRMYPPPLVEEPTFNVSYTRQPVNTASGSQQPGVPYYTDPGGPVMNPMAMAFHVQPNSPQGNPVYPPPPSYCNTPPPPYEQVVKSST
ncbi:vesicular, overexpressed in cancer, prosurvival protein 1 isoform X1 [Chiroxiphia lanceolata]|uniref:vesicular, overexpressed in cancer, prosurvival protein 1 isoform X1 n=1 Tax=Chiroxiphia lanceolata TaxID=296741 RepID=UPI0013CF3AEA|nr:vesicular, overexpressed in cancer, prosurvival protein 1 isoform X1 [Chiroxiphia lanceolata]